MHSLPLSQWDTVIRWSELPGDGAPLVCLPGLSYSATANFLILMTQPEFRGRRILMVDYVGSGLSGHSQSFGYKITDHSASIALILAETCSGPVYLLGCSMGGTVAIDLALARPDLVSKLVVCEGNLTPGGGEASRRIAASDQETFVTTDHPARMNSLAKAAVKGDALGGFLWAARAGADPRGLHGNASALVTLAADFQARFLALPVERHFVYGEKTCPANTAAITADTPDPDLLRSGGVAIHVVPGGGHLMMIDDPVATARVLGPIFAR